MDKFLSFVQYGFSKHTNTLRVLVKSEISHAVDYLASESNKYLLQETCLSPLISQKKSLSNIFTIFEVREGIAPTFTCSLVNLSTRFHQ